MPTTKNILVVDANQRSALAVTRSLGRVTDLTVYTADSTPSALAGRSRYCHTYIQCPCPERHPDRFVAWVAEASSIHNFHAVFPVTEVSSQLLLMNRDKLPSVQLPFSDIETLMTLADKGRLLQIASEAKIPVPPSRRYSRAADLRPADFNTFPIVIKPCLSRIWTGSGWIETAVRVVRGREELERTLACTDYLKNHPFMIQSYIPGHGAGVFALYDHGRPVAYFSHRRVREKPPRGGVSVVSESVAVNPRMRDYADTLLRSVNWHGVAMVEFRVAEDGTPYLMEVNTRFWGSLQLAIDAGVDFPRLLWQLTEGATIPLQEDYQTGKRLRWLLGDLDSLYLIWKDAHFSVGQKLARSATFFTPFFGRCRHEVNRWEDIRPAWFELRQYFNDLLS